MDNQTKNFPIKSLTLIGLMTAITCIISPFSIYIAFSPVPITFGIFAIYLALFTLGMKKGLISCLIYILLGLVGLPVFSGFSGGAAKLFGPTGVPVFSNFGAGLAKVAGPTGGYIIGYIFLAAIAGFFIDKWPYKWYLCLIGMVLGTTVCYFFGTVWLAFQMDLTFIKALSLGVLPYIPADLAKMAIALLIGIPLRKGLVKAHLL